jgi:ABC-type glycerol-3-phosphate transport system substrate-binding protein
MMSTTKLSRRQMLKLMGAGSSALALGGLPFGTATRSVAHFQAATPLKWVSWGGATGIKKIADAVARNLPDVAAKYAVDVVDGGTGDQDVAAMIRLALASGQNIPEMVQLNRTQVTEFATAGELLTLDDIFGAAKDDVYTGALDLAKVGDNFVAFPFELKSKLFYYRGDLFDQAGIDVSKIVTTDDFINAGKALQSKAGGTNILNLGPQPAGYYLGELVSAYPDSKFFADADGNYSVTSNAAFKDAFGFLKSLIDAKVTLPVDDWSTDWQPAIADGKIAGFLNANWLKLFLPTFAPEQTGKWKVGLWPQLTPLADQRYGSEAGGSVFVVMKRSANAQAAADYLRSVFLDKAGAMVAYNTLGTTPLVKSAKDDFLAANQKPVKPDGMSDADFAAQPSVFFGPDLAATELASYDYVKVLQYDPAASKGLDIINQWLQKYVTGTNDLDSALSGAEGDMQSQIGNPYDQ